MFLLHCSWQRVGLLQLNITRMGFYSYFAIDRWMNGQSECASTSETTASCGSATLTRSVWIKVKPESYSSSLSPTIALFGQDWFFQRSGQIRVSQTYFVILIPSELNKSVSHTVLVKKKPVFQLSWASYKKSNPVLNRNVFDSGTLFFSTSFSSFILT